MAAKHMLDIDTIIAADALRLKIGGHEYTIEDIPVTTLMKIQKADAAGEELGAAELLHDVLAPHNPALTIEEVKTWGARKINATARVIMRHVAESPKALDEPRGSG